MIIAFNHNFFLYHRQMETQHWERYFPTSDIWESTILLIGFGDIGKNIAIRAKAHGMQVIAVKRTMSEKTHYVDEVYTTESLDDLLPRADYVVSCVCLDSPDREHSDARSIGI
jgi:phosphoglycerate dehydrogenase-like enzyme